MSIRYSIQSYDSFDDNWHITAQVVHLEAVINSPMGGESTRKVYEQVADSRPRNDGFLGNLFVSAGSVMCEWKCIDLPGPEEVRDNVEKAREWLVEEVDQLLELGRQINLLRAAGFVT